MNINDLCQDFFDQTPLSFFSYFGFDLQNHRFWYCCTRPEVQEARLKIDYPMWAFMLDDGYYWYESFGWEKVNEFYLSHNLHNILTVVKRAEGFVQSFNFATDEKHQGMINFYFNEQELIEQFITHLRSNGRQYFESLRQQSKSMEKFFTLPPQGVDLNYKSNNKPYISNRFYDFTKAQWIQLSDREREVLYLFSVQGYTSKEIGQQLNISPKTVENHLDNLRIKLDVKVSKRLLIRAAELGMIKVKTYF